MSTKKWRICIFSLFRDSEEVLPQCLSSLESIEKNTDAEFEYYFYENDSKDNTVSILKDWMQNRTGSFISETLHAPKFGSTLDPQRMILLSRVRNKMLSLDVRKNSDYSIIFDSDVIFNGDIVNEFLFHKDLNFSMLTPNIRQDVPCKMSLSTNDSYYDSSILFDKQNINCMTWSDNPFYEKLDRENYANNKPIEVNRAFGSFAFLKTKYLKKCNWNSQGESEHWSFCDQLNKLAPIYFIPSIRPQVHIQQKNWPHEQKVVDHQKILLKNKWNRFLWKNNVQPIQ